MSIERVKNDDDFRKELEGLGGCVGRTVRAVAIQDGFVCNGQLVGRLKV